MLNTAHKPAKGRILVVDDTEEFRYMAERALRGAGYDVTIAGDYQQALDLLAGPEPLDLMLTDIVMPGGINGFALARMARMRRLDLKLLYMTAYDVPMNEAVAKILRKPLADNELVQEVKLALAA